MNKLNFSKKGVLLILILFTISTFVNGQILINENSTNKKVSNQIKAFNELYKQSLFKKEFSNLLNFYSNNSISMPEYQVSLLNKESISHYYSLLTKRFSIQSFDRKIIELLDLNKRIIEIGTFDTKFHLIEKDTTINLKGNYLNIWERTENGNLKVLVESWNYSHDIKNREIFTFTQLGKSSWNDSFLKIDTSPIAFELAGLNELLSKTVSSHNPKLWSQFFTNDAKYIYSHTPIKEGINAITEHLTDHCKYLPKFDKLLIGNNKIELAKEYVIEYSSHYVEWSFGETKGVSTGKDIRIWKRLPDCSLKIYRQIAMYDN